MSSHQINPMAMAFRILEEYKNNVCHIIASTDCTEALQDKILADVYSQSIAYLSLNRPYKRQDGTFIDFCSKRGLHSLLTKGMFAELNKQNLFVHQAQAIDSILAEKTTIISTGTGSGKTESFLIPVLHHCLNAKGTPGIKAIILYPMNALASDQLRRIEKAIGDEAITFGIFIGSTPQTQRKKMLDQPPDILITNYVMLDRLITKSQITASSLKLRYLVVDEIHSYRGTKGANLCLLLRRLRTLCHNSNQLVQIGASATLRQGGGYYSNDDQKQIQNYARSIFGQEAAERFEFITPVYDDEQQEEIEERDLLSNIDHIIGEPLVVEANSKAVIKLAEQLSGVPFSLPRPGRKEYHPLYKFAKRSPFIQAMRSLLKQQACTIDDLAALFRKLYIDTHQQEPRDPVAVVYAYLSIINELNRHFVSGTNIQDKDKAVPEVLIDYRLHLILNDLSGNLTCCLLCGQYHDGQRIHCSGCNGILFPVSKMQLHLCLARFDGSTLSPNIKQPSKDSRHSFIVLVERVIAQVNSPAPCFRIEPKMDVDEENECYYLYPASADVCHVRVSISDVKDITQPLELAKPQLYWQNVQRVIDAVLIHPETQLAEKLLGFIDNREKASSIRFRLRDEIAERTLTRWAIEQWDGSGALPLTTAYCRLKKQIHSRADEEDEEQKVHNEIKQELAFWFARMLTQPNNYEDVWRICSDTNITQTLQAEERQLIDEVFLPQGAIDRTNFSVTNADNLKHFFLEKYRISTEYGVSTRSTQKRGYDIVSLSEQGRVYQHVVEQIGADKISWLLESLTARGILIRKETKDSNIFYQLSPEHLVIKCIPQSANEPRANYAPTLIECHTADNSDKERTEHEKKFRMGTIKALICTPTLEMGVDIGKLSCVAMIGFPPNPASYAQRAGRAGRSSSLRSAIMIVLTSSGNSHDDYYADDPRKIIEGIITPPQFTLTNKKLLAEHIYAHVLAGENLWRLRNSPEELETHLRQCIMNDELVLQTEPEIDLEQLVEYLYENISTWIRKISNHEDGYRKGLFPDYGFRRDGIPLVDPKRNDLGTTGEFGVLTTREPEEAVRKLLPGRTVYCSGRPVPVALQQPYDSYSTEHDGSGMPFRSYAYLVAEEKDDSYVYARRESDDRYRITRTLYSNVANEELPSQGPGYCRIQFIRQGKIYVLNEGKYDDTPKDQQTIGIVPFQDAFGDYRIGTCLTRDGLLIRFPEQIVPPHAQANFVAVLLRSIPDYFNLDDGELRVLSNLALPSLTDEMRGQQKYTFLYGHDESGLVPFEKIFEHLFRMLERHLQILENCSCDGGCYRCLFSFNSRYLTGILSRQGAIHFLHAFLQHSLLQPFVQQNVPSLSQPDIVLNVRLRNNMCEVLVENQQTKARVYLTESVVDNQNNAIYTAINKALQTEVARQGRTVKIFCKPDYIVDHLQGKAKLTKGEKTFIRLLLTLRSWDAVSAERGQ